MTDAKISDVSFPFEAARQRPTFVFTAAERQFVPLDVKKLERQQNSLRPSSAEIEAAWAKYLDVRG